MAKRDIAEAARRWATKKLPGMAVTSAKQGHSEQYVEKVVTHALHWLHENVDDDVRRPYSGESDYAYDKDRNGILISITLKHRNQRHRIIRTMIVTREDITANSDSIAAMKGDDLGSLLARDLEEQHKDRGEWQQEYGEEYAAYNPTAVSGEFKHEKPKPKKPKKPKVVCGICGETDDKYPEWEGDCEHVIRDREEAKRKSRATRERTRKSKAAAKVRREAVAESSGYTQGRTKK